eukprot:Lithocolla_globosa_v1_NODE_5911_length_1164_cov_518.740307.p1 type:complete len:295 gc:universal NODE_5911_length_1164_cov_518.740307:98-982(+)
MPVRASDNLDYGVVFKEFTDKNYAEQCQLFMNVYWDELNEMERDDIFGWCQKFIELDTDKKNAGSDLDEFSAHRFLEMNGKTLTVKELREYLKEVDMDFNKRMAMLEYLLYHFRADFAKYKPEEATTDNLYTLINMIDRVVPDQDVEERRLMKEMQEAQDALMKPATAALAAVQAEINRLEDEKEALTKKAEAGGVKGLGAKNELEQLLTKDPTELNRKILTAEAALRKARSESDKIFAAYQAAKEERAKTSKGVVIKVVGNQGTLWWGDKEVAEMKKYSVKGGQKRLSAFLRR